jgi:hypothetical protein
LRNMPYIPGAGSMIISSDIKIIVNKSWVDIRFKI